MQCKSKIDSTQNTHDVTSVEHELMISRSERVQRMSQLDPYNLIRIHDSLQTMCDGEECDILAQLLTQRLLNDLISLVVC